MDRVSTKPNVEPTTPRPAEKSSQALLAQAADGIFIADLRGALSRSHRSGCQMLGYSLEEMLQRFGQELISGEDLERDGT